jgi:hypothetical protein
MQAKPLPVSLYQTDEWVEMAEKFGENAGVLSSHHSKLNTGVPQFTSLIHSSKTACSAKTRKMKISFPLLLEKRLRKQRSVCKRKEHI